MKIKYKEKKIEVKEGSTIAEVFKNEIENANVAIVEAKLNNEYVNLNEELKEGEVELIDISTKEGMANYRRTLLYIMGKAVTELYPDALITVDYQLSNSMFCEIDNMKITSKMITEVKEKMLEIIKRDLPIRKIGMTRKEAKEFFEKEKTLRGKLQLDIEKNQTIYMYYCEDYYNYFYANLAPSTGCIGEFDLMQYSDGFLIRYPRSSNPKVLPEYKETKKLLWALDEYEDLHRILNVNTVYKLNKAVEQGNIKDIIMLDEALHEKKIAQIADNIAKNKKIKMILIAGPSSSGKTTFAQRLGIQLRLNGLKPVTISVDNYFVERAENPKDENGEYDFECIEAIDTTLFNNHLRKLFNGEEVEVPEFDFIQGIKKYNGNKMKLHDDEVLIIEGIHCLNDKLTEKISKDQKYKIYISALTVLNMDYYNRISTTDTRLVRRIIRDYQFRGYSAKHTISTWHSVNAGEEKNIFPFQEEANSIFNTSLIYELGVLKQMVMPLLEEIKHADKEYAESMRIKNTLKYFKDISPDLVPSNSILKEFLGGGDFKY